MMWYESHQANALYRKGEYRLAMKNFQYIEQHLHTMLEDCYDFT